MRVFKNNFFDKFSKKQKISDQTLLEAVQRAEMGLIDADLGGGVIKQRVARQGEGKREGYRTLILYRSKERAFFVYGFAKNASDNITLQEKAALKKLAASVLNLKEDLLNELLQQGDYKEVPANVRQRSEKEEKSI